MPADSRTRTPQPRRLPLLLGWPLWAYALLAAGGLGAAVAVTLR